MSDIKEDFLKNLTADSEIDKKKKEVQANRINNEHDRLKEGERKAKLAESSSFGALSKDYVDRLAKESTEYIESTAASMKFICKTFDKRVPFFSKNLILIGADTGQGKSTCVANIVRQTLSQINPLTGKSRRCLVITNEENVVDFYNRVTCLIKGWHYVNHDLFTEEQKRTFAEYFKILSADGRLTVIDDNHNSAGEEVEGLTTTVEGIDTIFRNMMRDKDWYDVVIIDYYQGVMESTRDPMLDEYKVQRKLTHVLEKYRKIYPAPIVVMAQVHGPTEDERERERISPFQVRIHGTKLITTKATVIMEMIADRQNLETEWYFHKGRFSQATGTSINTGYDNGKFVYLSDEFKENIKRMREIESAKKQDREIGITTEEIEND